LDVVRTFYIFARKKDMDRKIFLDKWFPYFRDKPLDEIERDLDDVILQERTGVRFKDSVGDAKRMFTPEQEEVVLKAVDDFWSRSPPRTFDERLKDFRDKESIKQSIKNKEVKMSSDDFGMEVKDPSGVSMVEMLTNIREGMIVLNKELDQYKTCLDYLLGFQEEDTTSANKESSLEVSLVDRLEGIQNRLGNNIRLLRKMNNYFAGRIGLLMTPDKI
jgi:hypothetical protein